MPVQVMINSTTPLENVVDIAAGSYHSMAVTSEGYIYGWGAAEFAMSGTYSNATRMYNSVANVVSIVTSQFATYAITGNGDVYSASGYSTYLSKPATATFATDNTI